MAAKAANIIALKRSLDIDSWIRSSIVRTPAIARSGSICCTILPMLVRSAFGSSVVRIAITRAGPRALRERHVDLRPHVVAEAAVAHVLDDADDPPRDRPADRRLPGDEPVHRTRSSSGSRPFRWRVDEGSRSRPRRPRSPAVSLARTRARVRSAGRRSCNSPGVTIRKAALRRLEPCARGWPTTSNAIPKPPKNGPPVATSSACTPGSAPIFSWSCS